MTLIPDGWFGMEWPNTGECQVVEDRLYDLDEARRNGKGNGYCPARKDLYAALDNTPLNEVKVAIFGQDPYPNPKHATGVAFSIPKDIPVRSFPPTLKNIFEEYSSDLHYTTPSTGNLEKWCHQGVLLWNVIPTCSAFKPASHRNWPEWEILNKEIISLLNDKHIVFMLWGQEARKYEPLIDTNKNTVLWSSHPAPMGVLRGRRPFFGSRPFTKINAALVEQGIEPVDWMLPGSTLKLETRAKAPIIKEKKHVPMSQVQSSK